jgi:serine O-acetyltransferase
MIPVIPVTPVKNHGTVQCECETEALDNAKTRLPDVIDRIIRSVDDPELFTHIDFEPIPTQENVIQIVNRLRGILFPGFFSRRKVNPQNVNYSMGQSLSILFELLYEQTVCATRHECSRFEKECIDCINRAGETAIAFFESLPEIRKTLATDVRAMFDGDPAAKSHDEIIFSYPGVFAILVHRCAHRLYELGVPLLPRMMSEYAHAVTGIDIHPGAVIGESFAIDHGTGVVIGETTVIGRNVRIYQGVTLGALSLPKDRVGELKTSKRHPTIEDEVVIYSGATILGGDTVIGRGSVIGGNVWLTDSVPAGTRVFIENPKLIFR